jgi:hypothetical protein
MYFYLPLDRYPKPIEAMQDEFQFVMLLLILIKAIGTCCEDHIHYRPGFGCTGALLRAAILIVSADIHYSATTHPTALHDPYEGERCAKKGAGTRLKPC